MPKHKAKLRRVRKQAARTRVMNGKVHPMLAAAAEAEIKRNIESNHKEIAEDTEARMTVQLDRQLLSLPLHDKLSCLEYLQEKF
jgi:hypothetical protein